MPKKILTCSPKYFAIEYEINPWMHVENSVNSSAAATAHKQLTQLYRKLEVDLIEIEGEAGLPDMVYSANFGFPIGNIFIPANFKFKQRREEAAYAVTYFEKELGFTTRYLPEDIFYEGQGDHLLVGDTHFMGWGKRSDKQAKVELEKILGSEIIDLELVNPYFYHLDTALGPLNAETAIYNPESFTDAGKEKLRHFFKDLIAVGPEDASVMAPNLMAIGKELVMGKGISKKLKAQLQERGFTIHEIDTSEFLKGGGSIKCLSLEIY